MKAPPRNILLFIAPLALANHHHLDDEKRATTAFEPVLDQLLSMAQRVVPVHFVLITPPPNGSVSSQTSNLMVFNCDPNPFNSSTNDRTGGSGSHGQLLECGHRLTVGQSPCRRNHLRGVAETNVADGWLRISSEVLAYLTGVTYGGNDREHNPTPSSNQCDPPPGFELFIMGCLK